ncbi:conserved Plasmodium protein, unknown function [Plasmodium berghei]|uniref:Uncharacterized protein n=2 Tax=Plasmodium berghei TaxID=5821 RepID=A0A509AN07_PLABA|nr:conserved protein, unknown function [Plasmodium berghei ANKA]CXI72954.1 conserved Plasmodium protein, unknown function [Plasmodium berghei]SCM24474.1 conserved Plasmodium protein, unknown function [Plasmodium berghei]SCN27075.1 conserved Plasmodium protein, unknown function [Plasmodium berghei]SCO61563.1 conserved Plasmodium protein, unknown function [Plasmodium berghei]SCO63497.1 conserved Plasmodium protein, unknown function [Plasmodium berghei]|eukprot:XP_034422709.1 conserved protein, unknown function [Plasmodium berghei ANKA]
MSKYNVKFCFFPNLKNNFIKIQKQYGGASLLTKIGQSFNQEHIKNMKTKLSNYQKNSLNVLSKSNESNIFKNFIDIFKNTNIKEKLKLGDDIEKKEKEFFDYYVKCLMKYEGIFTYRKFKFFLKDLCDYFKIYSITFKYKKKMNPQLEKLKKQYEVLNSFLPHELDSDDYKIFHLESKKYLANSANVDLNFINELLLFHDTLKTDRTWFYRRIVLKRKLPESFEEREIEAPYDRPVVKSFNYGIKESSLEYEQYMNKNGRKLKFKKWISKKHPWFRKNTSGKNRWATRPYTKKFPYLYYSNIPKYMYLSRNKPRIKK